MSDFVDRFTPAEKKREAKLFTKIKAKFESKETEREMLQQSTLKRTPLKFDVLTPH